MRYAIFFVPEQNDPLYDAGARWLGRDAYGGSGYAQPSVAGILPWRLAELTMNARRYGFHATLKAPTPLADHSDETSLVDAVAAFCSTTLPVTLPQVHISKFAHIMALVPTRPHPPLNLLEKRIVLHFEPWRGSMNDEAMANREKGRLSARQIAMLDRWGYSHAVDEFSFHMTLTDQVPDAETSQIETALQSHFSPYVERPLSIDRLGIFVEDAPGMPFRILETFALKGSR